MTTYDTGNLVPSGDARDRFDNTQTLDELINSPLETTRSRLGVDLKTWAGMQADFREALSKLGYELPYLAYAAGVVVQRQTQLVERGGELYQVKSVTALPLTLTGDWPTDSANLVAVGDAALRQALADVTGATLVTTSRGNTVEFDLNDTRNAMGESGFLARFGQSQVACTIGIIGDSNMAANGSTGSASGIYRNGSGGILARSIMNAYDNGRGDDRGYLYYAWLNGYQQLATEPGWTNSGAEPVGGGPAGAAMRLAAGDWVEKTGVEVTQARVYYAPSTSGATMRITINGVLAGGDFTVDATGMSPPYNLGNPAGSYIKPTDVIRFTCVTGSIDVYNFRTLRAGGSSGPLLFGSPEGSQDFTDYSGSRADLLASYMLGDQTGVPTLLLVGLGTNNIIIAASKQKTPAAMKADIEAFIVKWRTLIPGIYFGFAVPPEPAPGATTYLAPYSEYVKVFLEVEQEQTGCEIVRRDLSDLSNPQLYADPDPVPGVHWNDFGHAADAKHWCGYLGIVCDPSEPQYDAAADSGSNANGAYDINSAGQLTCSRYFADLAVSIADGATYTSPVYPFPKAFSSAPVKFYDGYVTNAGGAALSLSVTASASGNTGWQFLIKNTSGVAVTRVLDLSFFAYGTPA